MSNDLTKTNKKDTAYWIKLAVVFAIMWFFRYLPPFGQVTEMGMAILGVFIGALFGWCFCDPVWPSFLAVIMLGLTGYSSSLLQLYKTHAAPSAAHLRPAEYI